MNSISVAVCTYNRAASLARTLDSMVQLRIPQKMEWELLLIDNNSSDNTQKVAESFRGSLPLCYVLEPHQGLSHARNRALKETDSDLILFTDDDVEVDSSWLLAFAKAWIENPKAGYLGGKIVPRWFNACPSWLHDEKLALLDGLLVNYDLGSMTRCYTDKDPTPYGASFAISRELINHIAPFRTDMGVTGSIPGRGEEAEYLKRAQQAGFTGVYVGQAICFHIAEDKRLSLRYMYDYGIQKGIAETLINSQQTASTGSIASEAMFALKGIYQLIKGRGDRFRQCVINMGIQRGLRRVGAKH